MISTTPPPHKILCFFLSQCWGGTLRETFRSVLLRYVFLLSSQPISNPTPEERCRAIPQLRPEPWRWECRPHMLRPRPCSPLGVACVRVVTAFCVQGINRLGKGPPKPGTLRPPDPNKYRTVDMFSEGAEGDADYMRMVQDVGDAMARTSQHGATGSTVAHAYRA